MPDPATEALRIYRDQALSPEEKKRRLEQSVAHAPEPSRGLSFDAYDDLGVVPDVASRAPNHAMLQRVPDDPAASLTAAANERRRSATTTTKSRDVARSLESDPRAGSGVGAAARNAVTTVGNAALMPYNSVRWAARKFGNESLPELDAREAYAQAESLYRDEPVAATRTRQSIEDAAHPMAATVGEGAGQLSDPFMAAEAMKGGLRLRARGGIRGDAPAPGKAGEAGMVSGGDISDPRATNYLNRDRALSSLLEREGYDALVNKVGPERARQVLESTRAMQGALKELGGSSAANPTTVYRGAHMSPEDIAAMERAGTYRNQNIWSVGTERSRAEGFLAGKPSPVREPVLFEIGERSAVKADDIPGSNTYEEALIPKGRKFKVGPARYEDIGGRKTRVQRLVEDERGGVRAAQRRQR